MFLNFHRVADSSRWLTFASYEGLDVSDVNEFVSFRFDSATLINLLLPYPCHLDNSKTESKTVFLYRQRDRETERKM